MLHFKRIWTYSDNRKHDTISNKIIIYYYYYQTRWSFWRKVTLIRCFGVECRYIENKSDARGLRCCLCNELDMRFV